MYQDVIRKLDSERLAEEVAPVVIKRPPKAKEVTVEEKPTAKVEVAVVSQPKDVSDQVEKLKQIHGKTKKPKRMKVREQIKKREVVELW